MAFVDSVLDRAHSIAKRVGAPSIASCHVVRALLDIDRDRVHGAVGNVEAVVQSAVAASAGDEARPNGTSDELTGLLGPIRSESDLWEALPALVGQLSASSSGPAPVDLSVETARSPGGVFDVDLIDAIASALGDELALVRNQIATDIREISRRVAPGSQQVLETELAALLSASEPATRPTFELVQRLAAVSTASQLARTVALALVGIARFSASVDDVVTDQEVAEIDAIRMELRSMLSEESLASSSTDDVFDRHFGDLVGLDDIKTELRRRLDYFLVSRLRRERGLPVGDQSLHMAFLGNPGTGKTHVARKFAAALKDLGVLSSGHLVEADRSGLVGQYVGHTEKKVSEVVDSSLGGVLFVDEAYALVDGTMTAGYGDQAIDVLVKRLEDDRARFVAVFAGYSGPMEDFLARNPGLRSRVPAVMRFPDYDVAQLVEIAETMAEQNGYQLDDAARRKLRGVVEALKSQPDFGNARSVRNVFEAAVRHQFGRLAHLGDLATDLEQRSITEADIDEAPALAPRVGVGFQRLLDRPSERSDT